MPKHTNIYDESDDSLPEPQKIYRSTEVKKPLLPPSKDDRNCCTNGSFCWYLFCICGLCE